MIPPADTRPYEHLRHYERYNAYLRDGQHALFAHRHLGWHPQRKHTMRTYNPAYKNLVYFYAKYPQRAGNPADQEVNAVFYTHEARDIYLSEVTSPNGTPEGMQLDNEETYTRWKIRHIVAASDEDWHRLLTCVTLRLKYNDAPVIRVQPFVHYTKELYEMMQEHMHKEHEENQRQLTQRSKT